MKAERYSTNFDQVEKRIDYAIQRVYEVYGANLPAFFSDVKAKLEEENKKFMTQRAISFKRKHG